MAFFGGSTGVIYKQFSLTDHLGDDPVGAGRADPFSRRLDLASPFAEEARRRMASPEPGWIDRRFPWRSANRVASTASDRVQPHGFDRDGRSLSQSLIQPGDRSASGCSCLSTACVLAVLASDPVRCGFRPASCRPRTRARRASSSACPQGATQTQTLAGRRPQVEKYFLTKNEAKNIQTLFTVAGGGGNSGPAGQNTGQGFIASQAPWDGAQVASRTPPTRSSSAHRAHSAILRDAQVFALVPAAIRGLGQSNGFTLELQNSSAG